MPPKALCAFLSGPETKQYGQVGDDRFLSLFAVRLLCRKRKKKPHLLLFSRPGTGFLTEWSTLWKALFQGVFTELAREKQKSASDGKNMTFRWVINSTKLPSRDRKRSRLFFTEKISPQLWMSRRCICGRKSAWRIYITYAHFDRRFKKSLRK